MKAQEWIINKVWVSTACFFCSAQGLMINRTPLIIDQLESSFSTSSQCNIPRVLCVRHFGCLALYFLILRVQHLRSGNRSLV